MTDTSVDKFLVDYVVFPHWILILVPMGNIDRTKYTEINNDYILMKISFKKRRCPHPMTVWKTGTEYYSTRLQKQILYKFNKRIEEENSNLILYAVNTNNL